MHAHSSPKGSSRADWSAAGAVLLLSCYELGRQPFNVASPWAQLEAAGFGVNGVDTAVDDLSSDVIAQARLVAISVPMHTATRLGVELARRVREENPAAHVCFYGLYASLNAGLLLATAADSVIGGEFEVALVGLANALASGIAAGEVDGVVTSVEQLANGRVATAPAVLRRLPFVTPKRSGLSPLHRYASFYGPQADEIRRVGYVEASRGCLHTCRHCPVTPVYQGRFFVVPREVVLADAEQQIAAGAGHITFGDPDFFNAPTHSMKIARALHAAHPDISFDATVKIEHLLECEDLVAELKTLGCAFVVSAVESLNDDVLARLDKGHTRADVFAALDVTRRAGVALRPTFVAFTPWTTLTDYIELIDWITREGLVDHLEPIQLAIRLLVPPGSALLDDADPGWIGELAPEELGHRWRYADPRMDMLFEEMSAIVESGVRDDPAAVVMRMREAAYRANGAAPTAIPARMRSFVPHLSESWFCCAEPTARQMGALERARQHTTGPPNAV